MLSFGQTPAQAKLLQPVSSTDFLECTNGFAGLIAIACRWACDFSEEPHHLTGLFPAIISSALSALFNVSWAIALAFT
jgi:hypothetical protein